MIKISFEELEQYRQRLEELLLTIPLLTRTVVNEEKTVRSHEKVDDQVKSSLAGKTGPKSNLAKRKTASTQQPLPKPTKKPTVSLKEEGATTTNILFSKLAFNNLNKPTKKSSRSKDPKQALEKVKIQRQKLSTLREKDPTMAQAVEKKDAWAKAIDRAQGVSIRDDTKLLKKSLKRRKKKKEQKKRNWEERKSKVKEDQISKQKKRKENIQARKDAAVKKKQSKRR